METYPLIKIESGNLLYKTYLRRAARFQFIIARS